MFGYNYWGSTGTSNGMTFEFVVEKNQFWAWRNKFSCSGVYQDDEWTII